jgi:hypothetical protein
MRTTLLWIGLTVLFGLGPTLAQEAKPASGHAAANSGKAAKGKGQEADSDEKIAEQLKAFCVKWMGFLETRERDNVKGIKWETQPSGVSGHYVGYSKEYDCTLKERSSNGTPVATIQYKEYVYQKTGASKGEADQAAPSIIDATEVTEIFRYSKGQWVY